MSDLVQRLRDAHSMATQADFAPGKTGLYREAADRIEYLESLVGAVSPGQSVADVKEYLRVCTICGGAGYVPALTESGGKKPTPSRDQNG